MLIAFWFSDELYLLIFLLWPIWETFLIEPKAILVYIFLIVILPRVCVLNVIYSLSCWTHHLIIYPFQAYSLIAGHFCWTFRTCSFGCKLYLFPLCIVSAPKLWIYMNSCIKTIELYYEVDFVVNAALNSDWVRISLCVSLGLHRYETLKRNLVYVPVMGPGFGSWHLYCWVSVNRLEKV